MDESIIQGSFRLMPADAPDDLCSTYGVQELEASARRLIAYCRQRPSEGGQGSWGPFSREEFNRFCDEASEKIHRSPDFDWLEGLLEPHQDFFTGPRGGGLLVAQDSGLIGITERFVGHLERNLERAKAGTR